MQGRPALTLADRKWATELDGVPQRVIDDAKVRAGAATVRARRHAEAGVRAPLEHAAQLKAEIVRLERQAGNLVRVLSEGFESPTVRDELQSTEAALLGLGAELAEFEGQFAAAASPRRRSRGTSKKLTIAPLAASQPRRRSEKWAEVRGRVKTDGLPGDQEAAVAAGDWLRGPEPNVPQRPVIEFRFEIRL